MVMDVEGTRESSSSECLSNSRNKLQPCQYLQSYYLHCLHLANLLVSFLAIAQVIVPFNGALPTCQENTF